MPSPHQTCCTANALQFLKSPAVKDSDTPWPTTALHIFAFYPDHLHSQVFLPEAFDWEVLFRYHYSGHLVGGIGGGWGEGFRGRGKLEDTFVHWLSTFLFIDHPQIPLLMSYIIVYFTCFQLSCPLTLQPLLQFPFLLHDYDARRLALFNESSSLLKLHCHISPHHKCKCRLNLSC